MTADTSDPLVTPFYVDGGVPNSSLSSTGLDGFAGFANAKAGTVTIAGEIAATGRVMDSVSLQVWPGAMTQSRLVARGR